MRPKWKLLHPRMTMEHLGRIPEWLNTLNPMPAQAQIDSFYRHGGGWRHFDGFTLNDDNSLSYPGDPVKKPLAETELHGSKVCFYDSSWVAVIKPDRSFTVARID